MPTLTLHLRGQKTDCLSRIGTVRQVRGSDNQCAGTYHVSGGAEDLHLVLGVVGDLSMVLRVACEAKENNTLDSGLDVVVEFLDGVIHNGTSLAIDHHFRSS